MTVVQERQEAADAVARESIAQRGKPEQVQKLLKDLRNPWPFG